MRPASLPRLAGRSLSTRGATIFRCAASRERDRERGATGAGRAAPARVFQPPVLVPPQFEALSFVDRLAQGVEDIDVAGVLDMRERFPQSNRVGIELQHRSSDVTGTSGAHVIDESDFEARGT